MPQTPQELADEIAATISRSIATIELAVVGLRQMADQMAAQPVVPENPDPRISVGHGDPNDPMNRPHGALRRSELIDVAQHGGYAEALLTQQWVVATFSMWEHTYRPAFAAASGAAVDQVRCDIFGDLRHLRNDVVHHGGVATAANAGKCLLLTRWTVGDVISLAAGDFLTILDNLLFEVRPEPEA